MGSSPSRVLGTSVPSETIEQVLNEGYDKDPHTRILINSHPIDANIAAVIKAGAGALDEDLTMPAEAEEGLFAGARFLNSDNGEATNQHYKPLSDGLGAMLLCVGGCPTRLLRASGPNAKAEHTWNIHLSAAGPTAPGRGRGREAAAGRSPDLQALSGSLGRELKQRGAIDVQVTVGTPKEEAGGHSVTITAYGRDRTLAAAVLQLVGSRPASLFHQDNPLHGAVLNFRALHGNTITDGDTQVLVVMREVEGAEADYQTVNMLKRAGEATVRKLLSSAQTLGDLRRRLLNYHGSILWSILSCSVRAYGKSAAEQQNLRQGHCPAPLFKYVVALNFNTGHQAKVLQLARHIMLGVRSETTVLMSALPFPPPAAELRAEDTHIVLLRNETFAAAVRPSELLQVLQALRTRAAEQDSACQAFAREILQKPELLLVSPSDDPDAGVQLQEEEDDCGFTPSNRSSSRTAPAPQAHPRSRIAPGLQEAHTRAKQADGGCTGRRALVLNSSRDEFITLLGPEAASPSSVITGAHWCSRRTGQLCPVSLHLARYGQGGITFKAPDDSADLALVCASPYDTASICAAAWTDSCFNPAEYASNQPSGLYLKGPNGTMTLTLAGIMHHSLGGRYVHTSYDSHGGGSSSSATTDHLLQKPTTTVVVARNLLAGEHYLTGAEQAYNLDTFSFAYQKQTGLMLYHPPTALALKPTLKLRQSLTAKLRPPHFLSCKLTLVM
eukprot:XP_001691178.1 predicted protein [Chlamydomonas reinhardtii]